MFEYFYNEVFRSVIIAFGSLFNDIEVHHKNDQDETWSVIKVPLAYGPTQKFLARMQQEADLDRPVQMTLPRMSFEFTNLVYDPERKTTKTQSFVTTTPDGQQVKRVYSPVPYNMTIVLSVYGKLNDDMLQITEQILPYFAPSYNLGVKFLGNLNEVKDVPIILDDITMEDDYEGNFETRRALVYTFTFTAKTYLYGPVTDITGISSRRSLLVTTLNQQMVRFSQEISPIRLHQELPKIMMVVSPLIWQEMFNLETRPFLSMMLVVSQRKHTSMLTKRRCILKVSTQRRILFV